MLNRRKFLSNLGLTGSVLMVPAGLIKAEPTKKKQRVDLSERTLRGKVQANGKAVAGVAVTDGTNVTVTDKNGRYEFTTGATSQYVYISVPAGYEIPANKGIAEFYKPLTAGAGTISNDFELKKLAVDDHKHNFVVWADTQVISKADVEMMQTQSVPDLKELVSSYPAGTLFHGIGCGDLVWDHFELFPDYKKAVENTGIPFYNVIGNHDMDLEARSDEQSSQTYRKEFGPTYYSYNRGAIHYVVLDDVFFIGVAKKYIGYLTENQLQWLEQDLALVSPGTTVVLSLHIPTNTGMSKRMKKEDDFGGTVSNRQQLYKILAPYKVHIMSGHTHFNENWEEGNIMEHNHGTVCGAWWTGPICGDGTPAGYGVYEVDGSDIRWYYKSTGMSKEQQFRIYSKGRIKAYPDEIAVNVWNWDNKWKVEWLENGILKGPMEQRIGLDPWAEELYGGPQLPKKHKWVEPTLNDHLFYAKPATADAKITIRVTDRFGKVYEQTI
ncbi:MAG: calcineurin-like phosphoesterase family protein [Chitinophagaceae bacterium]